MGFGATCLIIPGLNDSGPGHWQSKWVSARGDCRRVELGGWSAPRRSAWVVALDDAIRASPVPAVLVAHSLGCLAVAWWAAEYADDAPSHVAGAMLVAPADVDKPCASPHLSRFAPAPSQPLPFPSVVVASRDDPYASFDALRRLASCWGSNLIDVGPRGHINADSALGDWPEGQAILDGLIATPIKTKLARDIAL